MINTVRKMKMSSRTLALFVLMTGILALLTVACGSSEEEVSAPAPAAPAPAAKAAAPAPKAAPAAKPAPAAKAEPEKKKKDTQTGAGVNDVVGCGHFNTGAVYPIVSFSSTH